MLDFLYFLPWDGTAHQYNRTKQQCWPFYISSHGTGRHISTIELNNNAWLFIFIPMGRDSTSVQKNLTTMLDFLYLSPWDGTVHQKETELNFLKILSWDGTAGESKTPWLNFFHCGKKKIMKRGNINWDDLIRGHEHNISKLRMDNKTEKLKEQER